MMNLPASFRMGVLAGALIMSPMVCAYAPEPTYDTLKHPAILTKQHCEKSIVAAFHARAAIVAKEDMEFTDLFRRVNAFVDHEFLADVITENAYVFKGDAQEYATVVYDVCLESITTEMT